MNRSLLRNTHSDLTESTLLPHPVKITEQSWPEGVRPVVSICCVTYNHARFIRDCLDGFLMQETSFPVVIFIHEDASTDGTAEIVRQYEKRYPKIIFPIYQTINQYSRGVKVSRKYNYSRVTSKYAALCEGDDFWVDESKLEKQVQALESHPMYSSSFHATSMIQEDGSDLGKTMGSAAPEVVHPEDTISTFSLFHTSSFVFRSVIIKDLLSAPKVVSGDMQLFSIASSFGPIIKVPGVMSVYRKHPGGITSSPSVILNFHQDRIRLITLLNEFHRGRYKSKARSVIDQHRAEIRRRRGGGLISAARMRIGLRTRLRLLASNVVRFFQGGPGKEGG